MPDCEHSAFSKKRFIETVGYKNWLIRQIFTGEDSLTEPAAQQTMPYK
jgi:hypothetical protein